MPQLLGTAVPPHARHFQPLPLSSRGEVPPSDLEWPPAFLGGMMSAAWDWPERLWSERRACSTFPGVTLSVHWTRASLGKTGSLYHFSAGLVSPRLHVQSTAWASRFEGHVWFCARMLVYYDEKPLERMDCVIIFLFLSHFYLFTSFFLREREIYI